MSARRDALKFDVVASTSNLSLFKTTTYHTRPPRRLYRIQRVNLREFWVQGECVARDRAHVARHAACTRAHAYEISVANPATIFAAHASPSNGMVP